MRTGPSLASSSRWLSNSNARSDGCSNWGCRTIIRHAVRSEIFSALAVMERESRDGSCSLASAVRGNAERATSPSAYCASLTHFVVKTRFSRVVHRAADASGCECGHARNVQEGSRKRAWKRERMGGSGARVCAGQVRLVGDAKGWTYRNNVWIDSVRRRNKQMLGRLNVICVMIVEVPMSTWSRVGPTERDKTRVSELDMRCPRRLLGTWSRINEKMRNGHGIVPCSAFSIPSVYDVDVTTARTATLSAFTRSQISWPCLSSVSPSPTTHQWTDIHTCTLRSKGAFRSTT
jgi:hypothetical protein